MISTEKLALYRGPAGSSWAVAKDNKVQGGQGLGKRLTR